MRSISLILVAALLVFTACSSRVAPAHARGAALGVYNTLQSVGFFVGGAVGGWLMKDVGYPGLFAACAGLMLLWLVVVGACVSVTFSQTVTGAYLASELKTVSASKCS